MAASELARAVAHVDKHGILLVFPVNNRPRPKSLWSALHPKTPMRWEWDASGDDRVVRLWHLRARLAESRRVVYAKWFRGRATIFSRAVFVAMLGALMDLRPRGAREGLEAGLSLEARAVLEALEENSPQSTKELRRASDLQGRYLEGAWNRAMKQLWTRMLVVGVGEVDDGAFPSLAVGATKLMFEDLWTEARDRDDERKSTDAALLERIWRDEPLFARMFAESRASLEKQGETA